jgi:phosphatidate cytidylyltransferase
MGQLWADPKFRDAAIVSFLFVAILSAIVIPFRKRNAHMISGWASLRSWLFGVPIVFATLGADEPYRLYGLTLISVLAARDYFKMTGMFHRSLFVWLTYIALWTMGYFVQEQKDLWFHLTPMAFLGIICSIPILQNHAKNMLQYIALSLLAVMFLGWGFLHTLKILQWQGGVFVVIYLLVMSEFCDNSALIISRFFGQRKVVSNITPNRTLEGFIIAIILTLSLGYALRGLLPDDFQVFWLVATTVSILVGGLGDLILSVIRKDVGARDTGAFIWGRSSVLDRLDRMIFVMPMGYYALDFMRLYGASWLQEILG